ncbi:MAG: nicotinate (nicotinamide) nucleotide adenylyltransferase [Verrucomicrobia bacterium]|nr:MAG: nicotinate (nicotinamide) nucleotide adenylyltransferase [Verrucomicrobiota bacterium]
MSIVTAGNKKLKKIGIYGGSFDPIHHGHLILAREAREVLDLEKVIFVPAALSPLKARAAAATGDMRLKMLHAAIKGEERFTVNDCELRRPPPSWTIDTVLEIRKRETDSEIYLLIGEDNVATLDRWRRFDELKEMVRFVVLDRTGSQMQRNYQIVHRKIDISATEIRQRVAHGQSIRYLVPPAVEQLIQREKLYREQSK